MAAKKAESTAAPEYDFDNWSEEDEAKALQALAPDTKHIIVEGRFIGRFSDGVIVELPLNLTLDQIDALEAQGVGPVDQVKHLLETLGGKKAAEEFSRHSLFETVDLAQKFFKIFERVQGASVPE